VKKGKEEELQQRNGTTEKSRPEFASHFAIAHETDAAVRAQVSSAPAAFADPFLWYSVRRDPPSS
jgi:hypothetical protein